MTSGGHLVQSHSQSECDITQVAQDQGQRFHTVSGPSLLVFDHLRALKSTQNLHCFNVCLLSLNLSLSTFKKSLDLFSLYPHTKNAAIYLTFSRPQDPHCSPCSQKYPQLSHSQPVLPCIWLAVEAECLLWTVPVWKKSSSKHFMNISIA